jgi:hypothetical protein
MMNALIKSGFFVFILFMGCDRQEQLVPAHIVPPLTIEDSSRMGKGALLLSKFSSFDELKSIVRFEYILNDSGTDTSSHPYSGVRLTHSSCGRKVISILVAGVSELDFLNAKDAPFRGGIVLATKSPYAVMNRGDLLRVYLLARRPNQLFGEGDMAFYDLAETMVQHIRDEDRLYLSEKDLGEKGYLNTFNHVVAQAIVTSIFSERMADFIADVHERYRTPELITGVFTAEQVADIENGPVDNYLDMINNEWGQELGKQLREKYQINRYTKWTPALLTNYLNEIQSYHSWAFQISFHPFRITDDVVIRFSDKINRVMNNLPELRRNYY